MDPKLLICMHRIIITAPKKGCVKVLIDLKRNKAFVGLGSCDNVQTERKIFEYANWPRLYIKRTGPSSWFYQLVRPNSPSSWSVQLVRPAGPSSWSVQLVCPAYFKKSLKTKSKESLSHRLKNLFKHVARCTCFQVHMLPIAHIANCPCCKLHVL